MVKTKANSSVFLSGSRRLSKELHYSWPWALIGLVSGIAIGLISRVPLLPPPNAFNQQFWITFIGAVGGAAVTVIGTLHFTRVSRRRETLDAARALATLLMATVGNGQKIVEDMQPFPVNSEGVFILDHSEMRTPQQWDRYHTGAESLRRYIEQALADVALYKPSCIGLDLEGRRALMEIERALGLLKDVVVEFIPAANEYRKRTVNGALLGSTVEAFRVFPQRLLDSAAILRSSNVI